jgi:hypothetical protein
VCLLPGSAFASATTHSLRVNVPFSFVVAGQNFSAGNYNVNETENGVVTVQGQGKAAAVITIPSGAATSKDGTCLRFTSDGHEEHLSAVEVQGYEKRAVPVNISSERKLTLASAK